MINIFTALYCEAQPIIGYFGLKRQQDINRFQFFSNGTVNLLITGTGMLNAAVGVTSLCSAHRPGSGDILVNIGICGTGNISLQKGTPVLCSKIVDISTGKSCYPDMLFRHPFIEGTVLTSPVPVTDKTGKQFEGKGIIVSDMEAYGIFHAGSVFYQPHQMFFIKIVSDYETGEQVSSCQASSLVAGNAATIAEWIKTIHDELSAKQQFFFSDEETALLKKASEYMKLTVSMQYQLNQLMKFYKLQYGDFAGKLAKFIDENLKNPCGSKTEGKKRFDELRKRFV